jgi:zinc protease
MKNSKMKNVFKIFLVLSVLCVSIFAQNTEPKPSAPKSVKIPAIKETTLKTGLKVAVVERKDIPLVTVTLLIKSGAESEEEEKAGLANMTADLLTKGTKTRTATQIAEQMEFLGGSLNSGAGWNSTTVSVNVMADKLDQAMAIMADVALNPAFKQDEIDLLKSQTLDGLTYNLTQPGFLANYVASAYSFYKHPSGGTVASINSISRNDISVFYKEQFIADNAVLIYTGDITAVKAKAISQKYFGKMGNDNGITEIFESPDSMTITQTADSVKENKLKEANQPLVKRVLVVDLPNSGQAAVNFARNMQYNGRVYSDGNGGNTTISRTYFPATVLNSLLGGGYSSRLNQEIRIKRGLSYGAGSSFNWQWYSSDFSTRTQTKNESAAEVAELVTIELKRLSEGEIPEAELNPRRLVLTGGFGRNIETNQGLANAIADLYSFGLPADTLNSYMNNVMSVKDTQIKQFAAENFNGGDIIIVGDYAKFKDDLAKRFPDMKIEVIKADELDITKENLRKSN